MAEMKGVMSQMMWERVLKGKATVTFRIRLRSCVDVAYRHSAHLL